MGWWDDLDFIQENFDFCGIGRKRILKNEQSPGVDRIWKRLWDDFRGVISEQAADKSIVIDFNATKVSYQKVC